jgi:spermidine/putrescine transport system permease protein
MVITIYLALEKLDNALLEASASLGASKFETFRKITLPLSRPGVATGLLLVFVPCLGTFVEPRILGGVNGTVIGTVIEDQFFKIYGWNFGAAIAFILLAMVILSVSLFTRLGKEAPA